MTDYTPIQQYPAPQAAPPRNGLGTAGLVAGLVGLVFSPIPFVGVVAWPLVVLGLILSAVGVARVRAGKATNRGLRSPASSCRSWAWWSAACGGGARQGDQRRGRRPIGATRSRTR